MKATFEKKAAFEFGYQRVNIVISCMRQLPGVFVSLYFVRCDLSIFLPRGIFWREARECHWTKPNEAQIKTTMNTLREYCSLAAFSFHQQVQQANGSAPIRTIQYHPFTIW